VVGLHSGAHGADVADALATLLGRHRRVVRLHQAGPEAVERAEAEGALALLHATADDGAWRTSCLRQADQVVLVAAAGSGPPQDWGDDAPALQPDLVLVGARRPAATMLSAWAEAVDPWHITVCDGDLAVGLRALADRVLGRSVGLVLAGGGARAFAHVGVLRELEDAGIAVDRVAGCSVGSIVAGLHAIGLDGATLDGVAYEEFVRRRPFSDYGLPIASLAHGRRARDAMRRRFGADTVIEGLPRQFACVTTDIAARTRVVHRRGSLVTAVRASVGLPVLFPPLPDGSRLLVDGGILDNLPVDLLTQRDEGPVVAVNIAMGGSARPPSASGATPRPPRVPALGETLLRTMMIGSSGAVAAARARGAFVVTPSPRGVGLLEFHQMDRMVEAGRAAVRALLEQTGGDLVSASEQLPADAVPAPRAPGTRRRATAPGRQAPAP
jgi:predicted acylesterase/phospholipase RssA